MLEEDVVVGAALVVEEAIGMGSMVGLDEEQVAEEGNMTTGVVWLGLEAAAVLRVGIDLRRRQVGWGRGGRLRRVIIQAGRTAALAVLVRLGEEKEGSRGVAGEEVEGEGRGVGCVVY